MVRNRLNEKTACVNSSTTLDILFNQSTSYALSLAAKLNIVVDALLATEYCLHGCLELSEKLDHLDIQLCLIRIKGVRLTSQFDESACHHANGYHLRRYIQEKNAWSDQ